MPKSKDTLSMNRILFETDEIVDGIATFGDARAAHVLGILHGEVGQELKTGVVNGPVGTSTITDISDGCVSVEVHHDSPSRPPWVDLLLAPPRPRAMKRLLPQLAALGVGSIVLVGAKKVEKDFWGATLLKEEVYRPLLLDGLMQAGTTSLPLIATRRNFRRFVDEELNALFPTKRRIVAHPYAAAPSGAERHARYVPTPSTGRLLLAVGPEGGWTDDEVALLENRGFSRLSLGPRILRTETAVVGLLVKLNNEVDDDNLQKGEHR